MPRVMQALISVSDKAGVVELARALAALGVKLLSTGGTARLLRQAQIAVTEVSDYTGFPEMLDGRVKTLHPVIHGGILARRELSEHMTALDRQSIAPIDLVVVNLYPFRDTVRQTDCTLDEAIENIDIGGPTLVRAAAKNFASVAVVVDPNDYGELLTELRTHNGVVSKETRFKLAQKAFAHTAGYDGAISNYLGSRVLDAQAKVFPIVHNVQMFKAQDLRYGENPHQLAAFYRDERPARGALATYRQLQGKALSYNNIADADAAWECVKTFGMDEEAALHACVIVKHANPCGVATADHLLTAYRKAFATDPTSAFGGIIAFNHAVDASTVEAVTEQFLEVLIAPGYTTEALALIAKKSNVRVLEVASGLSERAETSRLDYKRVGGGFLVQTADDRIIGVEDVTVVTRRQPTSQQWEDLLFSWRVAKFVKSNAIVFAADGQTLGIGAGQMSRVDSARIAAIKAENARLSLRGAAVASDAFFPFRDGLDVVVDAGATAVIQPGGSVRDDEVIAAANERDIVMVFTGVRHFRH